MQQPETRPDLTMGLMCNTNEQERQCNATQQVINNESSNR